MKFRTNPTGTGQLKGDWVCYQRSKDPNYYVLYVGDKATVDPQGKSKEAEKIRGRVCQLLSVEVNTLGKVNVRYLDNGRLGRVQIHDLIPQPADVITMAAREKACP